MASSDLQPRFHSAWARAMYQKIQHQEKHENDNHEYWYAIHKDLLSPELAATYFPCYQDKETSDFLENCFDQGSWFFTQAFQGVAKSLLTWFITATSANGLLNRGSMFVFSQTQLKDMLQLPDNWQGDSVLDLGAGDGMVTEKFIPFFRRIFVTEMSPVMRWRLQRRGFHLLDVYDWHKSSIVQTSSTAIPPLDNVVCEEEDRSRTDTCSVRSGENSSPSLEEEEANQFDVISCLNLLDRCDTPGTILQQIRARMKSDGRLIVALVLPLRQYVEFKKDHRPEEEIPVSANRTLEIQLDSIVKQFFAPLGFQLLRWSRVPYLCQGDFSQSFYSLTDVLMVFRKGPVEIPS